MTLLKSLFELYSFVVTESLTNELRRYYSLFVVFIEKPMETTINKTQQTSSKHRVRYVVLESLMFFFVYWNADSNYLAIFWVNLYIYSLNRK